MSARAAGGASSSDLAFRNVDARVDDPVETWPTEALETAMERGGLPEWRRIAAAVRREPWGHVATTVESILTYTRPYGVDVLLERVITAAREQGTGERGAGTAGSVDATP